VVIGDDLEEGIAMRLLGQQVTAEPKNAKERIIVAVGEAGSISSAEDLIDPTAKGMGRANVFRVVGELREKGLLAPDDPLELTEAGQEMALSLGAALPELDDEDQDEDDI